MSRTWSVKNQHYRGVDVVVEQQSTNGQRVHIISVRREFRLKTNERKDIVIEKLCTFIAICVSRAMSRKLKGIAFVEVMMAFTNVLTYAWRNCRSVGNWWNDWYQFEHKIMRTMYELFASFRILDCLLICNILGLGAFRTRPHLFCINPWSVNLGQIEWEYHGKNRQGVRCTGRSQDPDHPGLQRRL